MFLTIALILSVQFGDSFASCPDLVVYKGSEFQPNSARVHIAFLANAHDINCYAKECDVKVYITSSFRRSNVPVPNAIVTPAVRSNHHIGHAIDMNLVDKTTGRFCNSRCLILPSRPAGVSCFINKIRSDSALRWGGDFNTPDVVHIDDNTNRLNPTLWNQLNKTLQENC